MKYIAFYDSPDNKEKRNCVLAATNKLEYIFKTINDAGIHIDVISASASATKKAVNSKKYFLYDNVTVSLPFTLGSNNGIKRRINQLLIKSKLLFNLLFKTKKSDDVIVYHSLYYMSVVKFAKRVKDFNLIVEAEEIYSDVTGNSKTRKKELEFFKSADAFVIPTELLNKEINKDNKPYVIIYGTYKTENARNKHFDDGKIHVVYAGTFDDRKGGCQAAIASAKYLSKDYVINIIGFGNEKDVNSVKALIEKSNAENECQIIYDGMLSGEEYIEYIQSCQIGLSTQKPDGAFNDTSFPSKVLSYMANGLKVVSVNIPVLESSSLKDYISFCSDNTGENVAKAIINANKMDMPDCRILVDNLNKDFCKNIKQILGD